jgi:hypothetical protein
MKKEFTLKDFKKMSLKTKSFEIYLVNVGIRSVEYTYDDKILFENVEYFKMCYENDLSAYKALLFLGDYLDGDYKFD